MTTVAAYLLTRLQQAGLEHLFAVPGDYAGPFLKALDATPGIARIPTINELGAGYAADGYARYRGIGAACVQYGVGTFSLLNCVAGSFVERVPVAIISASPKASDRKLEREKGILFHHSTGDLQADKLVFRQVTVAAEILADASEAPIQIDRAIAAMLTCRRPVYLEGLNDVWDQPCCMPAGRLQALETASNLVILEHLLNEAWKRIAGARLPVLWIGVEVQRFGLQNVLQQLADASGIFFTTTSLGKTVLDESQQQFIGTYAGPASPLPTLELMEKCDCPVALGTIITDDYLDIMHTKFDSMIEVTGERARIGKQTYPQVSLKGFLEGLLHRFQSHKEFPRTYTLSAITPKKQKVPAPDASLTYVLFFEVISEFILKHHLKDSIALILGESTSLYVFGNLFGMPRNSFVAQAAWGSLGHETGAALGIALGSGKRPFVVAGDGGFMMICQELSSLARQQCNAVVFVISNRSYSIEQAFVDINAFKPDGTFAPFDLLPAWDYLALATAFGVKGYKAETTGQLQVVLKEIAGLTNVPALVEVVVPQKDLPPQLARLAAPPAPGQTLHTGRHQW
ncbi:MAG: alpha-keto acid decarboxylase family protein [Williamsia sp.]|nr:alpha-keto acid decarboxylase family protein [Williamsia sp.]